MREPLDLDELRRVALQVRVRHCTPDGDIEAHQVAMAVGDLVAELAESRKRECTALCQDAEEDVKRLTEQRDALYMALAGLLDALTRPVGEAAKVRARINGIFEFAGDLPPSTSDTGEAS